MVSNEQPVSISVVVPTRGGRSLLRSVHSALEQRGVDVEIIVVMNGVGEIGAIPNDPRVRVIHSSPALAGNGARARGIVESRHALVALLDDDDYWEADKLALQYRHVLDLNVGDAEWIVSCAVREHSDSRPSKIVPIEDPNPITDIAEYLARRPQLHSIGQQFQSSTLLFTRQLGIDVPFDPAVRVHQDWGWVIDAQRSGARVLCLYEPLSHRVMGSPNAITGTIRWRESLRWGTRMLTSSSRRARGDFAMTIPADRAMRSRDLRGWAVCGWEALRHGSPGLPALIYFLSLLVRPTRKTTS